MIIDLETQIWNDPAELGRLHSSREGGSPAKWRREVTAAEHDDAMNCVDVSVILGFRSQYLSAHISAERVAAFVSKASHRRVGFVGIDPMTGGALPAIDHAVSLGLVGVTMSPAAQNYHPTHSAAMRVYERCQELGLPLLIKHGWLRTPDIVLNYARPALFDEIARSFPKLKIVISQMGFPWIDETLVVIGKHENVYTDTAGVVSRPWQLYNSLLSAFEYGVIDKVLFASNFPAETPERAIKRIYTLNAYSHGTELPSIPRQQLRGVIERDSLDLLGIERPGGASISRAIGLGIGSGEEGDFAGSAPAAGSEMRMSNMSEMLDAAHASGGGSSGGGTPGAPAPGRVRSRADEPGR